MLKKPVLCNLHRCTFLNVHFINFSEKLPKVSSDCLPELTDSLKFEIESKWFNNTSKGRFNSKSDIFPKKYVLSMFPYPSGNLHMGHVRVYTIGDTMAWFYRLNGFNVLHPIGFDAFGLPAENAALEHKVKPDDWTGKNIETMRIQLKSLGFSFDWEREIITCDPSYFKFTQYLFLLLYKAGLVFQKEDLVNWDPIDKTVLAHEQVDERGRSWRSGALVEKKILKQWFFETTRFAKLLSDGLNGLIANDWRDIISLQNHWIGDCNGYIFNFSVLKNNEHISSVKIWTKHPELMNDCSFLAVKSSSLLSLLHESSNGRLIIEVLNPINNEILPVFINDDVEFDEGTDIKLIHPVFDDYCREFALNNNLKWTENCSTEENIFERNKICELAFSAGIGGYQTSSKLKDWAISRQRRWGTPIPIVYCTNCGTVPVPLDELPFEPYLKKSVNCPLCNQQAVAETDTMDTFVDSSWYFLRFIDPYNDDFFCSIKKSDKLMPVDLYVGGKEHAVLHLYYARFITYFLNSIGLLKEPEPFRKLLVQGMVMGKTFKLKETGKYLKQEQVEEKDGKFFDIETKKEVKSIWEKMSKSKYNGIEPNDIIKEYGIDTTRLFVLSDVAPTSNKYWKPDSFPGILNWQNRLWSLVNDFMLLRKNLNTDVLISDKIEAELRDARNYYCKMITFNYGQSNQLSVAISKMQGLTNSLKKINKKYIGQSSEFEKCLASLLIMISPMMPHFSLELWEYFQKAPFRINKHDRHIDWDNNVLEQSWPKLDDNYLLKVNFAVNKAIKDSSLIPCSEFRNLNQDIALKMALSNDKVKDFIGICDILGTKFNLIPDYESTIDILINHEQKWTIIKEEKIN